MGPATYEGLNGGDVGFYANRREKAIFQRKDDMLGDRRFEPLVLYVHTGLEPDRVLVRPLGN